MKNKIKSNIENPEILENLYQTEKKVFEKSFFEIYPEISPFKISAFWKARFDFQNKENNFITKTGLLPLILICIFSGILIKLPQILGLELEEDFYYAKNGGLIVFLGLSLYSFFTKESINKKQFLTSIFVFLVSAFYINLLPSDKSSHSIILVYLHLPLMIWSLYGLIFFNFDIKNKMRRIDFIKHNGDLAILGGLILIAGGILSAITLGLFSAIQVKIEKFYIDYIVIFGLVSAPVVTSFIIRLFPHVTNKIAPIIAQIFSPLVLITLVTYLVTIIVTGKNPYNDRDFLIIFNLMLIGVMGIIVFSISETSLHQKQRWNEMILFILTLVTLIIDLVALSAILYRLGEFGFTPNRTAVLGSNLLIFGNLVLILIDFYKVNFKNKSVKRVELTVANYLPIYTAWTVFVVFVLPLIFGFK